MGGGALTTKALFNENVCKNERIGSRWGGGGGHTPAVPLDPSMVFISIVMDTKVVNLETVVQSGKMQLEEFMFFVFGTCVIGISIQLDENIPQQNLQIETKRELVV